MSLNWFDVSKLKETWIDCLNKSVVYCCGHTQAVLTVLAKIKWETDYEWLLNLSDKEFKKWQDYIIWRSFNRLKEKNWWFVTCQWCSEHIATYKDSYARGWQFFHRWECSTTFYEKDCETDRSLDYYERMYHKRLATWTRCDIKYIEDRNLIQSWIYILFPWWQTHVYTTEHWDFRIWIDGWAYIECIENNEIWIFFRSLRYCLENDMTISEIIDAIEDYFGKNIFGVNEEPLNWFEIFLENTFTDEEYNFANHSYKSDITDYDLNDGNDMAIARMIWILSLSQWQRKASIISWLRLLKQWEYLNIPSL